MGAFGYQSGYISPEALSELQKIFESVWQVVNAANDGGGRDASALRRDLAEIIMAHRDMEDPTLLRETALQEIRNGASSGRHRS
jgi:hypothetical protein